MKAQRISWNSKIFGHQKKCCNYPKIWIMRLYQSNESKRCRRNGEQCRPWSYWSSSSSLIKIYTVCPGLSVRKLRIITNEWNDLVLRLTTEGSWSQLYSWKNWFELSAKRIDTLELIRSNFIRSIPVECSLSRDHMNVVYSHRRIPETSQENVEISQLHRQW